MDPRRLAALDMYGLSGAPRRRALIRAEFLVGAAGCLALGAAAIVGSGGAGLLLGAWLCGAGLNYVPLALHAVQLSRPGALERELAGEDLRPQLRRAGVEQLWIAVPLAVLVADLRARQRRVR